MNYFTGVGSRRTPERAGAFLTQLSKDLVSMGLRLRSGHAAGADRACEVGADGQADIYLPWSSFGTKPYRDDPGMAIIGTPYSIDRVFQHWHEDHLQGVAKVLDRHLFKFNDPVIKLMRRNMAQVSGHGPVPNPSKLLICWTDAPEGSGGTQWAITSAQIQCVPVVNIVGKTEREVRAEIGAIIST